MSRLPNDGCVPSRRFLVAASFRAFHRFSFGRCGLLAAAALLSALLDPIISQAATITKADNTTALNATGSWTGAIVPGAADIAQWTSTVTGSNSDALGADLSWLGISVVGPGGAVTITGANTLTLGTSGIDMSAATQNLTIQSGLTIGAGNQVWNVVTGETLTTNTGTFTRTAGATLNLQGGGTIVLTNIPNSGSTGIIGPWATFGTGTSMKYAVGGATASGLTGTIAADANAFASATANYDFSTTTSTTLTAGRTANTIHYTGTGDIIDLGASGALTLTLNGILATGASGTLTIQRTGGTGTLAIGTTNELDIAGPQNVTISAPISGTAAALVYSGSGTLTLSGANTYTGKTTVNSGTLTVNGSLAAGAVVSIASGATVNLTNTGLTMQGSGIWNAGNQGSWGGPSNASAFTGTMNLAAGTRFWGAASAVPTGATIVCANNAQFGMPNGGLYTGNVHINGNGWVTENNGGLRLNAGNGGTGGNFAGTLTLDADASVWASASGGSGTVSANTSGAHTLTVGTGTVTFSGINSFGSLSVPSDSTAVAGSITAFGGGGLAVGGTAQLSGKNLSAANLSGAGNVQNGSGTTAATLTVGSDNSSTAFSGGLTNGSTATLGLIKTGSGSLILSGTNTYTGTTAVNVGKLYVSTALSASSAISVAGSARFGGSTSVGAVTVSDAGAIESSNGATESAMTLTTSSLAFNNTANLYVTLAGTAGASYSPIVVSGALTASGGAGSIIVNPATAPSSNGVYHVAQFGSLSGSLSNFAFASPARALTLQQNGNFIDISVNLANYPIWTGGASGDWSLASEPSPKNWKVSSDGSATDFLALDAVVFDDTAAGTTNITLNTANVSPGTITFNNSSKSYALSGTFGIANGNLIKNGTASLTIGTVNSFNGGTAINAGTTTVNSTNGLGVGALQVTGGVLVLNGTNALSSASVSGGVLRIGTDSVGAAGSLTSGPVGTGTLTLSGGTLSSADTTARTLNNALNFTADSALGDATNSGALSLGGAVTLTGNRALTVNSPVTISGAIGQDAAGRTLTAAGPATLTLSGALNYTGGTTVSGGTLITSGSATPATVNIGSGAFYQPNSVNANVVVSGTGTWTLTSAVGSSWATNGNVSGFAGTTTIASGLRYWMNGATNIPGGTITVASGGQFGIAYNGLATANLHISGSSWAGNDSLGALRLNSGNGTTGNFAGTLTLDNDAGVAASAGGGSGTISANVSGAHQLNIVTGTVTFSGANSFGSLSIPSGNAAVAGSSTAFGGGGLVANGTAQLSGNSLSVGNLTGTTGSVQNGSSTTAATLTVGSDGTSTTFGGVLSNGGTATLGLTKTGGGALTLTANNSFTGDTTVGSGILILDSATNGATPAGRHTLIINAGGTVNCTGTAGHDNMLGVEGNGFMTALNINGGTFNAGNFDHINALSMTGGALGIASGLTQSGADGMDFRTLNSILPSVATSAASTSATISSKLTLSNNTSFTTAAGTVANGIDLLDSGIVVGGGTLTKAGAGTMALTGSNTYSGGTTVSAGTLSLNASGNSSSVGTGMLTINSGATARVDNNNALGIGGGGAPVTINAGGTLSMVTAGLTAYLKAVTLNGGTLSGPATISGNASTSGSYDLDGGVTTGASATATSTISAQNVALTQTGGTVFTVNSATTQTIAGIDLDVTGYFGQPSGVTNTSLVKNGTGVMRLDAANTYTSATSINGGTLRAGAVNTLPSTTAVTLGTTSGVTLDLNGFDQTIASLSGGGTAGGNVTLGSGTLTIGGNAATTFSGSISGGGGLRVTGSGPLTLASSSNSYTGATTITAGKLYIDGSNTTSSISVSNGGTLGGAGAASAATATINNGGVLEAGHGGSGTLGLGGLTFGASITATATVNIAIGGSLPQYSQANSGPLAINNTGDLTANGGIGSVVVNLPTAAVVAGTYRLIGYSGSIGGVNGFNAFALGTTPAVNGARGGTALLANNTNEIDLVVTGDYPVWTGAYSSEWSLNTGGTIQSPYNWNLALANTSTDFIAGDTVHFTNAAANRTVDISQANVSPGSMTFDSGNYTVISTPGTFGIVDGPGGPTPVVVNGGSVTINTVNSYTGGTTLNGGALTFVNGALGSSGNITFAGNATLQWATGNTQDVSARIVMNNGVAATIDTQSNNIAFATAIGGGTTGSLIKLGSGALTLTAANIYTGGTTVSQGVLSFANGALGTTGPITVGNAALQWNGTNTQDISSRLTLLNGTSATLDIQSNNVALATAFGGGTTAAVTKLGSGTLTLTGANTYTGLTTVGAGTLITSGSATPATINITAGAVYHPKSMNSNLVVSGSGTWQLTTDIGSSNATNADVSGFAGTTTIASALRYWAPTASSIPGGTIIIASGGQLGLANSQAATANVHISGNSWAGNETDGAIRLNVANGSGGSLAGTVVLDNDAGIAAGQSAGNGTVSAGISGNHTLTLMNGTITLSGANSFGALSVPSGSTAVAGSSTAFGGGGFVDNGTAQLNGNSLSVANLTGSGALQNGSSSTAATMTVGSDNTSTSFGGAISNGGSAALGLIKSGSGTLTLTAIETYSGLTAINGGLLSINGSLAAASTVTVNDNAALSGTGTLNGPVSLAGGSTGDALGSTGTLTLTSTLGVSGNNNLLASGTVSVAGATTINDGATFIVNGTLQGAGFVNLAAASANSTLSGTGTVSNGVFLNGNDTLGSSGTLTLGSTLGVGGSGNQIAGGIVSVAGTVSINDGANLAINGTLQGAGAVNLAAATVNSTLSGTGRVNNAVTLAGSNTLSSTGTLTLGSTLTVGGANNQISSGTVSVAGLTTINGSLRVAGTLGGAGTTTVNGTLSGTGTVGQAVTVAGGGQIVAAGGAILSIGSLTLSDMSSSIFTLPGSPNSTAMVAVAGTLTGPGTGNTHTINFASSPAATLGIYDLFSFTNTSAPIGTFSIGTPPTVAGGLLYKIELSNSLIDLDVYNASGSAQWNSNNTASTNNWSDTTKWTPNQYPNLATQSATFADGNPHGTVSSSTAAMSITVDGTYTVGSLAFNNANTAYTLASGGGGTGLILDNGASVATISDSAGSHTIAAGLTLSDAAGTTISVATSGDLLTISGAIDNGNHAVTISGAGNTTLSGAFSGSGSLTMSGSGTLRLGHSNNSYSGVTTVSSGTLRTGANIDNALGTGALVANAPVSLGGNENIGTLSGSGSVTVAANKTLAVTPTADQPLAGLTLNAAAGPSTPSLLLSGSHVLTLNGAATLNTGSIVSVGDGTNPATLRMNLTSNATVGTSVSAIVAVGATLELDGMNTALQDGSVALNRASITNSGTLAVGNSTAMVPVTGAQQVGGIDGTGSVVVADNSSLTADHINQTSLVIGNGSTFTLAPSDMNGNPMVSGLVLAGSLAPSSSFIASSGSLLGVGGAASSATSPSLGGVSGASVSAVPEPSSGVLLALGALAVFHLGAAKRKRSAR